MNLPTKVRKELNTKAKAYYRSGVNINFSFKRLEAMANEEGLNFNNGDILIVDNTNGDKRKAFKKTADSYIILYVGLIKKDDTFAQLPHITSKKRQTPEYFV